MKHKRQTDMFDPSEHAERHVTVVGLGNIGSHSAQAIARMGINNFTLYDFDEVEEHNLASQAYTHDDIEDDTLKTDALGVSMSGINPTIELSMVNEAFRGTEEVKDILIIAVDSMHERRLIQAKLIESGQNPFVIDGRMGGGQIEVHAQYADKWADTFVENPDSDPCSARYISYTSYMIAGAIANTLKRYLQGERLASRFIMHVDTWDLITEWHEQG